ncbi:MAG TPA: CBS domain-containing protein [Sandaracinaceae bacterium LLY-WYZ-13_1]|nr:CBS domain-containing protein [Sandaracinaceae bacterium LLY-WYZ-13_1]
MTQPKTVADVMTREVVVLREEDNLGEVAADMERYRFRHLPVVDGETLVGIISQRDLLRFAVSQLERSPLAQDKQRRLEEHTFVYRVMTRDPETVLPETPLKVAAAKLVEGRFNCLPVVNARNELVGIITNHDLLEILADRI